MSNLEAAKSALGLAGAAAPSAAAAPPRSSSAGSAATGRSGAASSSRSASEATARASVRTSITRESILSGPPARPPPLRSSSRPLSGSAGAQSRAASDARSAAGSFSAASRRSSGRSFASAAARSRHSDVHDIAATARLEARRGGGDELLEARSRASSSSRGRTGRLSGQRGSGRNHNDSSGRWDESAGTILPGHSASQRADLVLLEEGSMASDSLLGGPAPSGGGRRAQSHDRSGLSSFADAYESKADVNAGYGRRMSDGKSQGGKSVRSGRSGNSGSRFGEVKDPLTTPDAHHMDSSSALLAIEESNNSLLGDTASRAADMSLVSRAPSHATRATTITEHTPGTFVPRRFDEMRALLTSVTPAQLEALVDEIFDGDAPPGWRDGRSRNHIRDDAYLSEMSLVELRHYASGMDRGLRDRMSECDTADDALDLIAIEFERLVSRHQNGLFGEDETLGNSTLETRSHFLPDDSVRVSIDADSTVDGESSSLVSQDVGAEDEGAKLRRSLRACSLAELRLVAERLQLDHSGCPTKADLIVMIERSMPDMAASESGVEGGHDQQQDGYEQQYPQPQQQQRPRYDRNNPPPPPSQPPPGAASGRVKFTSDTKADRSHLIPRREKDGGAWQSYVTGPAGGNAREEFVDDGQGRHGQHGHPDVDREYGEDHGGYHDDGGGSYGSGSDRPLVDEYGYDGGYRDDGRGGYRDGRDGQNGGSVDSGRDGPSRPQKKRGRDRYVDERKSRRRRRRYALPAPLLDFLARKRLYIAGLLVVIAAAVAVPLVLTKNKDGPPIELTFPDPTDPWSMDVGGRDTGRGGGEPTARPSPAAASEEGDKSIEEIFEAFTRTPVAAPTKPKPFSWEDMYKMDDSVETEEPTREPTPFPGSAVDTSWTDNDGGSWVDNDEDGEAAAAPLQTIDPTKPQNYCASSPDKVQETCGTNPRYCNDEPCEPGTGTFCFPMQICDSAVSALQTEEMAVPIREDDGEEDQGVPEFNFEVSTPEPTREPTGRPSPDPTPPPTRPRTDPPTESLYPLISKDVTDMRIVLYGVSRLSIQGRTQWIMLTAAYVEQFYELNDGPDAVQNIVFDVVASVKITGQEDLPEGDRGRGLEDGSGAGGEVEDRRGLNVRRGGRVLQSSPPGIILTFNLNISYRTRSAFVTTEAVADRPFYDAGIREGYIRFLSENGAQAFIGDVEGVSRVFRGDDLPNKDDDVFPALDGTDLVVEVAETATGRPSRRPTATVTARPSRRPTKRPASDPPTPEPTPGPTPRPSRRPSDKPTGRPSTRPSDKPSYRPTRRPAPILAGPGETLSTATNVVVTDAPTPVPSRDPTDKPTKVPTSFPTDRPTAHPSARPTRDPTPGPTYKPSRKPSNMPSSPPTPKPTRKTRTGLPTSTPTPPPTTARPTTGRPTSMCAGSTPVVEPVCPFLTEDECCDPMCTWAEEGRCAFIGESSDHEVDWLGAAEIGQTHVVKAEKERRHAPRVIAHREAEFLFTPGPPSRRVGLGVDEDSSRAVKGVGQDLGTLGEARLIWEDGRPVEGCEASSLLRDDGAVCSVPNTDDAVYIIVDLGALRMVQGISVSLHGDTFVGSSRLELHYDDGRGSQEDGDDDGDFAIPRYDWSSIDQRFNVANEVAFSISQSRPARYVKIRLIGGSSDTTPHWGVWLIRITGRKDGLLANDLLGDVLPTKRRFIEQSRSYIPLETARVRVAVFSPDDKLVGVTKARAPSGQRGILERVVSFDPIDDYSDSIWSVTLPYNWIAEGNTVAIGCVDPQSGLLHIFRVALKDLAHFSEHTITRTKVAIFGTEDDLRKLDTTTHDAKKIARDLFGIMPVAELKWADSFWHLPYLVVAGTDGPKRVTSEEERREATGLGEEGAGFAETEENGDNSPYASGTSVFMGWSLSKEVGDDMFEWEDLGYWDKLAAAAWVGWCVMKAGDECSNYFSHELGHSQSLLHFDYGTALDWNIEDEYPFDGVYTSNHPWGYDTVQRMFRTWFNPLSGKGKNDPLNGNGENPLPNQCFSQYTPYQAKKAQEWAMDTPVLLSSMSSEVSVDGAYRYSPSLNRYARMSSSLFSNAVGETHMKPDRVGVPVITLIGTIGKDKSVCQTYPALRSRLGNTFVFPDPFDQNLPLLVYAGAQYFVEVNFPGGTSVKGLIASKVHNKKRSLSFYSFNVAIDREPTSIVLRRFIDYAWPDVTPETETELLHIRPTNLNPEDPLEGLPSYIRVGRGWLGNSQDFVINEFCITGDTCDSDSHSIEWRSDVSSTDIVYTSTVAPASEDASGVSLFKIPATRYWDDTETEYSITLMATRHFNDGVGSQPLLAEVPFSGRGSSQIDATHVVRVWVPWELNGALPAGTYRSHGAFTIQAMLIGGEVGRNIVFKVNVSLNLATFTQAPTRMPTRKPSRGPTQSPVPIRYYIDWKSFTCTSEGEATEWSTPYRTKEECCKTHVAYL